MNVIDAAHKTVKDYPGGAEALGARIDMSPAVLRSKVNPNTTTHHLTLAEADEIMSVSDDHRILHALAAEHGFVLRRAGEGDQPATVLQSVLAVNAAEGEFDRALHEALADGVITPNELQQLEACGLRQQGLFVMLLQKLNTFAKAGRA